MTHLPDPGILSNFDTKPSVLISRPNERDVEKGVPYRIRDEEKKTRRIPKWIANILYIPSVIKKRYMDYVRLDEWAKVRNIDKCAQGYPRLAAFIDSDPNFMIYRRFGYLRTRLLLYHQDVLRGREKELDSLDSISRDDQTTERQLCCRAIDENQEFPRRKELFEKLNGDFQAYGTTYSAYTKGPTADLPDKLLLRSASLYELDEPVDRNRQSVARLIWNDGQLAQPDRNYIHYRDDLVTLGGDKEHSWVHLLFERGFTKTSRRLSRFLFQTKVQAAKSKSPLLSVYLYSKQKFDFVVACFFTAIITGIIIAPVFVLTKYQNRSDIEKDCIVMGFTSMFAIICSGCTTAKRHEVFAATAAYGAVLVVFVSQGPGSNSTNPPTM